MNGPLVDAAKKILKREYGVECTEPSAGVDRFRRRTGNTVAQVDLEGMNGGSVYKLRLCGFCYDNDEKYEEEKQIKPTESANPKDLAEIIDEYLSKVETNLHILIKMHRPYSKKKRILNLGEAKEILKNAGRSLVSEENVQLSDKFRTAWNSLMSAMSDLTNWNRVVMWYAGDKYDKNARSLCDAYAKGQYSLHEIIEKMKQAGSQWYRDLFSRINAILSKNDLEVTGDRCEFSYRGEPYKIVPVGRNGSGCSFEIRYNSNTNTPQIHSEEDVFKRTPFIEDPDDALDALERIVEEEFSDTNRQFSEAKELLESVGFIVEHVNSHPLYPKYFVRYLKKLLDNYGFQERGKDAELRARSYLYTYDTNATRFEISEEGEYDDEIVVNILFSGISSDGSVYTIVADDTSYNGDNIEDFKADLDQVFKVRE